MKKILLHSFFSLLLLFLAAIQGYGQVSINTANFIYLENFNSYNGTSIGSVPQWTAGGSFSYRGPGNGSSNTGGAWSYGTGSGAGSERALGYLGSGTSSSIIYAISFVNNTGAPITQLEVSYDMEQWRFESGNTQGWFVLGNGALTGVSVSGLNSNSVNSGTNGTVQVTPKAIVLTGLNLLPNATFGFQFSCGNGAGNDNGVAIDNFRLAVICTPTVTSVDTTLCAGAAFVLNGNTYTTAQTVSDTLTAANGCDSIVNYDLNFLPPNTHSFADTTCFGTTYIWGSQNLTTSGSYNQTFTSATNCDSIVTLNLFVRPANTYSFADTTCFGATYTWGTQNLTATGSYNQTFTSATNCDSIVTLNLFVRPANTYSFADTTCFGTTYTWGTQNLSASGSYNQTFTSAVNCDSVVTLNLFVRPANTYSFADTTCFGATYTWGTQNLTASGSYNQTFTSAVNCDSFVTLNLFVRPANTYSFADTTCFGTTYTWGTQNLTASGSYNQTFTSAVNCDSVVTLNLFVRPANNTTSTQSICSGSSYTFDGQVLTTSGVYTATFQDVHGCDSNVTLTLNVGAAITSNFADTTCFGTTYTWVAQNYTTSGSYNHTFSSASGCDSIVTLNLFVRSANNTTSTQSICSGSSYTFGGQVLTTSGVYTATFQDVHGCDSNVTLTLNVGGLITSSFADTTCFGTTYTWAAQNLTASGSYNHTFTSASGCDSTVTLNLFVRPANNTTSTQSICSGSSYTFGGQVLTTSGVYTASFQDVHGCDSNVTLTLNVGGLITSSFADTTCFGTTYTWVAQNYTTSGSYNHTFTSASGCDSTVTLNLFVRPANNTTSTQSICSGSSYTFGGQVLTTSGVYTASFQDVHGCDSNVTLTLNVGGLITSSFADTTCFGTTYTWAAQNLTTSGSYNHTFTSASGCDSTVTLNLFVRPANNSTSTQSICSGSSYTFGGQVLTTSGVYTASFQDVHGCDSNVTLTLNVGGLITSSFADTTCFGTTYTWAAQNLTASGSYNHTFTSASGCDSTVTLNLFVRPANNTTSTQSICSGSSYTFGGQVLTTSGVYTATFQDVHGCDSNVTLTLNVGGLITSSFADTTCFGTTYTWVAQNLTASGSYNHTFTSASGCDSTVTLNLFVRPANNTTSTQSICSGSSYTFGGQVLTTSGVYTAIFQDVHGCDSNVTLTLNVGGLITSSFADTTCFGTTYTWVAQNYTTSGSYNHTFTSASGCDSTVTLNLFVRPAITSSFSDTTCFGTTYTWAAQNLTASGSYNQTFTSASGCDSTVTLNLFVRPANNTSTTQSICSGSTYTFGGQVLSTSGVYTASFLDVHGCDSNVTLTLNVGAAITYSFADTTCFGTTYTWAAQNLTASGSYNHTFASVSGCDSIATLNLFVRPAITYSFADTTCFGTTYTWAAQNLTASGTYSQIFTSALGCDSTVTLSLFVLPSITSSFADTACFGATYGWGAQSLTASGSYNQIFTSASGCDSAVTLNLFVYPAITYSFADTTCSGVNYTWGTQSLGASGIYTQIFTSVSSCDSTVTLNLFVHPVSTSSFSDTVCAAVTYNWGGLSLTTSGVYNQTFTGANGCDSLAVLYLTVRPLQQDTIAASICYGSTYILGNQILSTPGYYTATFTNIHGCDSIKVLNLQVSPQPVTVTIDTAACETVWFEGTAYTSYTTLVDTFSTSLGCDSVYRIVNIAPHDNNPIIKTVDTISCGSLTFEGKLYTESTSFADTVFTILGCDSIIRVVNIKIGQTQTQTIVHEMCAGRSVTFNGQQMNTAGSYPFTFKNKEGCDSVVVLEVTVHPLPDIEISGNEQGNYCAGDSINLQASGAETYTWTYADVDTFVGDNYRTILFGYKNGFSLTGTDQNGCTNTASIVIDAQACCNIWMPNAFSPNGDGMNDVFRPESRTHPKEYVMHIYNRWGETVFSTFDISKGWDGNINGKPADIADYYYWISGKCVNGEIISMKGLCTLLR